MINSWDEFKVRLGILNHYSHIQNVLDSRLDQASEDEANQIHNEIEKIDDEKIQQVQDIKQWIIRGTEEQSKIRGELLQKMDRAIGGILDRMGGRWVTLNDGRKVFLVD